ncbi:Abi family protein [Ectothiorhodospira sp. PHS-1]|uniref:Abi family protein n=1 Tax=Ectothiorhodospira sp. PHS-1 TaxID=519989 RepID=UPI00024A842E|nr:Abi family protein [Ectothiorhodospira sp. PHS-1]EHQ52209.1 Abi family protein [Ectothiorhodospira sp. PHS-1]
MSRKGYPKPWKSYEEQLDLLISRGLAVTNRAKALDYLQRIGYYRLSGYWYPFRERSGPFIFLDELGRKPAKKHRNVVKVALDEFRPGARFEDAVKLYVFDKKLRLLAMDALERIEIALRVDISHTLGEIDPVAYLHPELFHDSFSRDLNNGKGVTRHHEWLGRHARLINESKEEFVRHNKTRYGLPLVIWVACEVWDFGTMSRLFAGMRERDQDAISAKYGIHNGRTFATWLRSLNYLRNVCAHHSRLWNRNIVDQPKLPPADEVAWVTPFQDDSHLRARCYLLLRIARHLLQVVNPSSSWPGRVKAHMETFPDLTHLGLNLAGMGAPDNWETDW